MLNYRIDRRFHIMGAGMQAHGGMWPSAAGGWWTSGGATGCVAAYQAKGAASLAASYSNLANPGTYDAAPGVAPTWASGTGWTFNGSTQYLDSGVVPVNDQTWSFVISLSGVAATNYQMPLGVHVTDTSGFGVMYRSTNFSVIYRNGGSAAEAIPGPAAAILGVAGTQGYKDGATSSGAITAGGGTSFGTAKIYIGAASLTNGAAVRHLACNVLALAIYNTTITAEQVAAVSTAMAAL